MAHPAGILEPLSHERALDILSKLSKITFINLCTRGVAMSDISETADLEMQIEALISPHSPDNALSFCMTCTIQI